MRTAPLSTAEGMGSGVQWGVSGECLGVCVPGGGGVWPGGICVSRGCVTPDPEAHAPDPEVDTPPQTQRQIHPSEPGGRHLPLWIDRQL